MYLSIIIPVFNEQDSVVEVLKMLNNVQFPQQVSDKEIIIVDDCSTDNSRQVIGDFIRERSGFRLIEHEKNKGKGSSVKTGIEHSNGDVLLIQDADLELSPSDIPSLIIAMLETKVQFINGSRYLPGVNRPLFAYRRYVANQLFTNLTSLLINVKLTDVACAYKLFTKELYEQLTLQEKGFGFESELMIKAMRVKKNNIAEVPVKYFPRNQGEGKKLKTTDGFIILWVIIKYGLLRIN